MPALLAANPYLGIGEPNMKLVGLFAAAVAAILVAMYVVRMLSRAKEARRERQAAWRTFHKLGKARGLDPAQIKLLAAAVRRAKVVRPSQVLASVQLFDTCVNEYAESVDLTDTQQAHLEAARKKLVSTVEQRDKGKERRNLARAETSLPVQLLTVAREWVEDEVKGRVAEESSGFREVLERLMEGLVPVHGQMQDISAGGMSVLVLEALEVQGDDYARVQGGGEGLPIDVDGLSGQVVGVEERPDDQLLLHIRFLTYAQELRKQIIRLVYEKQESAKGAPAPPSPPQPHADGTTEDSG